MPKRGHAASRTVLARATILATSLRTHWPAFIMRSLQSAALRIDPSSFRALILGVALRCATRIEEARAHFARALALKPVFLKPSWRYAGVIFRRFTKRI